ncbi:MAG: glutamate--tRNA ligase [Chlorobi bacterium]|nr:glutamate--tRNA ligase [Chlorobiota bacterium]
MNNKEIRVRFAPSPTGPLHIGGVRTALYNYLFARNMGGKMILRIEDTDQKRYVEGAEKYIVESLKWCGIEIDEGVEQGGDFGPYRQSERKDIYRQYAEKLIGSGHAYYAFDTADELDELRKKLETEKASNKSYSPFSRMGMKNSLTIPKEEVQQKIGSGEDFVIRYKMPENEEVGFSDIIRGNVVVNTSTLDDKVLFKSDGMPTYHLANIVDDHLMGISHVIRGEEWLPSLPLHVLLYRALGWDSPEFAHLPLILKPNGKGKLSKRDGDKGGFPVFPIDWNNASTNEVFPGFRESGYFPEAFVNIMAFLGWNPGTEQEVFSMGELIKAFDLKRVGKAGARFDSEKARWFNHQHLQIKPDEKLASLFQDVLVEKGIYVPKEFVARVVALVKERASFIGDFWEQASFFFETPKEYDAKMVKKRWKENTPEILNNLILSFNDIEIFDTGNLETHIKSFLERNELGMGQVMTALRLALVGSGRGPGVFEIMELLGKDEVVQRVNKALETIKK